MGCSIKSNHSKRWPQRLLAVAGYSVVVLMLCAISAVLVVVHYANKVAIPARVPIRPNDPYSLLAEGKRLSWLLNPSAADLFAQAEVRFHELGDVRNEAWARIGRIRGQAVNTPFARVSRELGAELENDIVKNDARLKLWCLAAKGYTDLDIDPGSAKRSWTEALQIANRLGDTRWATRAQGELGILGFLQGDTAGAASLLGRALLSTIKNGDVGGQIRFLEMLGNGYNEVHRYSEALRFFDRAINLARTNSDIGFPFMGYEGRSEALLAQGRITEARETLQQALAASRAKHNLGHEAAVLVSLGKLEAYSGNQATSLEYLENASRIAEKFNFNRTLADSQFQLAGIYSARGNPKSAETSLERAISSSRAIGDRYFLPRDLAALATLKLQLGQLREADVLYVQAEEVIDGLLINANASYWRSGLSAAMGDIYVQHFKLVLQERHIPRAFEIIEHVRGRAAAASLQARSAFTKRSPAELALENQISDTQLQLMHSENASERPQLLDNLLVLERQLGLTRNELALSQHEFLNKPATVKAVQSSLRPDEELLEYVLDEPQAFCISVSRERAIVTALPAGRKAIEQLADSYLSRVRAKGSAPDTAKRLYSILLSSLVIPSEKTRLIIVPDGKLHLLSFDALMDSSDKYLIETKIVSYVTSASVFHLLRNRRPFHLPARHLLAIGDVPYKNEPTVLASASPPQRLMRGFYDLFGGPLSNLPATREEVLTVSKETGDTSTVLLGEKATEAAFKAEPLDDFKVLHLAVHGVADVDFPDRAALVLGRDPRSKDDGLLQSREIADLRLNADLVTLSACDTATGKLQGEEGINNLEEAFFIAGARAVVASLWSADDTLTSALMEEFYKNLRKGWDKAEALREAKLALFYKYGKAVGPFYWAGFVLAGDGASSIAF